MDIIELSREIGRQLQKDEKYIAMDIARQNSDNDEELQALIGEFNLKRIAINNEATKQDRDDDKLQRLNKEMRDVYAQIMKNENMTAYNNAKNEFDVLVQRVLAIISQSAEGEDPNTTDYSPSCTGSCSSCSGCH
ncbi:MAG: YlbF family regulator [Acutalibacteraceae bacterium]